MKYVVYIGLFLIWGCTKETIVVSINGENPQALVVDAWITSEPGEKTLTLSETGEFGSSEWHPLEGAKIECSVDDQPAQFTPQGQGSYTSNLTCHPGEEFEISIEHKGKEHGYKERMPQLPTVEEVWIINDEIDHLAVTLTQHSQGYGYYLFELYKEIEDDGSFYWEPVLTGVQESDLQTGDFRAESSLEVNIFEEEFVPSAQEGYYLLKVHHIPENTYRYLEAMREEQEGDIFSTNPTNPTGLFTPYCFGAVLLSSVSEVAFEL